MLCPAAEMPKENQYLSHFALFPSFLLRFCSFHCHFASEDCLNDFVSTLVREASEGELSYELPGTSKENSFFLILSETSVSVKGYYVCREWPRHKSIVKNTEHDWGEKNHSGESCKKKTSPGNGWSSQSGFRRRILAKAQQMDKMKGSTEWNLHLRLLFSVIKQQSTQWGIICSICSLPLLAI